MDINFLCSGDLLSDRAGYSVWICQRVDLLYCGYCLHLDTVCGSPKDWICCTWDIVCIVYSSTTEWICCILDIVHILKQTAQMCKLSEYLYTDILCCWTLKGSQDKDILC